MPRAYECSFNIRHYECDASGGVNPANYLRFMQEAAYSASANAGYDMVGYHSLGSLWFIRETEIVFVQPLQYGDCVLVRTWVEDFHRVRSLRAYEMRKVATGELVAHARSDWVYLDSDTGLPSSIPDELIAAFIPDSAERISHPRNRFPATVRPAIGSHCQLRRVEWRDLDPIRHVNNAVYLTYIDECGLSADQALGWPVERMTLDGVCQVKKKLHIEYRQPAVYNDRLEVCAWITRVDPLTATRHFTIRREIDKELLCHAQVVFGWSKANSDEAIPAPEAWLRQLDPFLAEGANE